MRELQHYLQGQWIHGSGKASELFDASTGEVVAQSKSGGLNFKEALHYGRTQGGATLRKMTFHERARALKALALFLLERKETYYNVSTHTGATRVDSWIDIEGGIGNLFVYSSKGRRELPDLPYMIDGKSEGLSKGGTFIGQHICVPLEGVAIHINAFNFPIWGMLEKLAVNFLAGVPAIVKPATATSYLTEVVVRDIISSGILPEGSLQLICGSAGDLLDHVTNQDIVTFTGSASTGLMLKSHPRILGESVRFNMEADSLNCSVLGPDGAPGTQEFDLFVKEVAREITVKAGQKCTAIRRSIVPEKYLEDVSKALIDRLKKTTVGHPTFEGVRMGPLASLAQQRDVLEKIHQLKEHAELLYGGTADFEVLGADSKKGAFVCPTVLHCPRPLEVEAPHAIEAFGPVTTLMPYKSTEEAILLARKGEGSLVGSIVTMDRSFARDMVVGAASYHGRLLILNHLCAKESTGHGSPMPQMVHGGPGRAGGGEEMGGLRGLHHYMQRTALQGDPTTLSFITQSYLPGADRPESERHPFKKFFEELQVGETLTTHKRTVTEADVVNFANLSWDHFYAHTDETSLDGTLFEKRVAHGYFVISMAAGLFVDPGKGPVLANYGLDELRFVKPVYVGATLGVKLTCKEKINQDDREGETPRGIVKWQVDVSDETGETVALATILTLVQKKGVSKSE
jgi:oxepin-CoA hydrolase / 3-oxo-5,6-dehydrosuberyl-CoA semialdehyde dehydrogenase